MKLLFKFKNTLPVAMQDVTLNIDVDGMRDGEVLISFVWECVSRVFPLVFVGVFNLHFWCRKFPSRSAGVCHVFALEI